MVDFSLGSSQKTKDIPVDRIISLRSQGLSNDQIVQTLQNEGYRATQIFDAIKHAEIKESMEGPNSLSISSNLQNPIMPSLGGLSMPTEPQQTADISKMEEIAEAIIDEKWNILVENVNKIIDWKERVDSQISGLNEKISMLKQDFSSLQSAIVGKTGDYDKTMKEVSTDIKAMSKVFQKILPGFIEKVNELSVITENIKGSKEAGRETERTANLKKVPEKEEEEEDIFEGTIDDIK